MVKIRVIYITIFIGLFFFYFNAVCSSTRFSNSLKIKSNYVLLLVNWYGANRAIAFLFMIMVEWCIGVRQILQSGWERFQFSSLLNLTLRSRFHLSLNFRSHSISGQCTCKILLLKTFLDIDYGVCMNIKIFKDSNTLDQVWTY